MKSNLDKLVRQVGYLQIMRNKGLINQENFDRVKVHIKNKYSNIDIL